MKNTLSLLLSTLLLFWGYSAELQAQVEFKGSDTSIASGSVQPMPVRQLKLLYVVPESEEGVALGRIAQQSSEDEMTRVDSDWSADRFELQLLLRLYSTAGLARIYVKVGRHPGGGDVVSRSFAFDAQELIPPYSYNRSGKTIVLGLGEVTGLEQYHAEVILENDSGVKSEGMYYGPME